MEKKYFAPSELIINEDGSAFHLHLKPEQVADKVILVGDPGRVETVASFFDSRECEVSNREFKSITGSYQGKRITVLSTGIGCDNIDIVMNELDARHVVLSHDDPWSNVACIACIAGLFAIRRYLIRRSELKEEMVEIE